MPIPNNTRGWLLVIPLVPALIISIFNLNHLLRNQILRTALHNHVIILLLLSGLLQQLTDVIWYAYYNFTGVSLSSTPTFCLTWACIDAILTITIYFLISWASIERHILIFYPQCFATSKKRLFFHYIPLMICIIWPTLFYSIVYLALPCPIKFDPTYWVCNRYVCITRIYWLALWDSIIHRILSAFIISLFSITLLIRVIYHRYHIRQRIDWRNYKRLAGQLLPISTIYLMLDLPSMIMYILYISNIVPDIVRSSYYNDSLFFLYWIILFTPFATVISLPELKIKCKDALFFWRKDQTIAPVVIIQSRTRDGQAIILQLNAANEQ